MSGPLNPATLSREVALGDTLEEDENVAHVSRRLIRSNLKARLFDVQDEPVRLDRFVIVKRLGQGGMGVVYHGYDPELDRRVAIKVLRTGRTTQLARKRMAREARALARLSHPNVVHVYDAGIDRGRVFIAMEFVEGMSVQDWCASEPRPSWHDVLDAYLAAAAGLSAAHDKGLIHRDIKPANLLRGDDGRIRVADFGLARGRYHADERQAVQTGPVQVESRLQGELHEDLTRTGGQMGTPMYMAPEQFSERATGAAVGPVADQYSLCVGLYEGLYGALPFTYEGSDWGALYKHKCEVDLPDKPPRSDVPEWIHRAVIRGLSPDPKDRYPSMAALRAALRADPMARRRVRRRLLLGLIAIALAIALPTSLLAMHWLDATNRCETAASQIEDVWGAQRQRDIADRFRDIGVAYAPRTAERTVTVLDRYADAWSDMRMNVCESRRDAIEDRERDRLLGRDLCLTRRLQQFDSLVVVFTEDVDADVVENAVHAALSLPPVETCLDDSALATLVRPSADPQTQRRLDSIRARIDRLQSLYDAGKFIAGVAVGDALLDDMRERDELPVRAEAMYWTARLHRQVANHERAERLLRASIALAAKAKDQALVTRALSRLVHLVGAQLRRFDEANVLVDWMRASVELSDDPRIRADALRTEARLLRHLGQYERARDLNERAVQLWETMAQPDDPRLGEAWNSLAGTLRHLDEYRDALKVSTRALALLERALGDGHPRIANTLTGIALSLRKLGQYEQALEYAERALAIRESALGSEHPSVASSLNNRAIIRKKLGRLQAAHADYRRALTITERHFGRDHPRASTALNNLANLLREQGKLREAQTMLERSLQIRRANLGPRHPDVARALNNLAVLFSELGAFEKALNAYQQVLDLWEQTLGPDHSDVAIALNNLGMGYARMGAFDEAHKRHARALAIREASYGPRHPQVAVSLIHLGNMARHRGDLAASERHLQRAREILESAEGTDRDNLPSALVGLAELRVAQKRPNDALSLLQQARRLGDKRLNATIERVYKQAQTGPASQR